MVRPARAQHRATPTRSPPPTGTRSTRTGSRRSRSCNGVSATFMAKPSEKDIGSSCHIHSSLVRRRRGASAFVDGHEETDVFRHYLGGLRGRIRELALFIAPSINSYKRYAAESWAPTSIAWGRDNRTAGFRVVGHGQSRRAECRIPGADVNPYLGYAALLAAGLDGIANETDPGPELKGNAYAEGRGRAVPVDAARGGRPVGGQRLRPLDVRRARLGPLPQLRAHRAAAVRPGRDRLRAPPHVRARMISRSSSPPPRRCSRSCRAPGSRRSTPPSRAPARRSRRGARWRRPTARRCCARSPTRSPSTARSSRCSRRATPASRSPTRAARWTWSCDTFRYYAGAPERLLGDTIPVAGGQAFTVREPLGVVGLIVPWNFPLTIASWKLAPALAAGNTVVLKPAELTPLTALRFAQIATEAGIPDGVVNVVVGPGSVVRSAARRAPRRREDRVHRLDRGRAARSPPAPPRRSSA